MKHYIQWTLEENQRDKVSLHTGTNDLSSANKMVSEVIELVDICKRLNIDIIVSKIVSRGDDLNVKEKAVNNNIQFLKHEYNSWYKP